ncbi:MULTISPECIES: hypothetical protein [Brevibacillus]|uniref:hypothetical protein n=1 Tax=Brevibacillus TaxID=55080 RepID=UPI001F59B14E|nr:MULTISPECIES: hypothetical protein [Brevibacillus]MCR8962037.1 hypothetical protein [Brevibacillus laterosporus]MCZ0834192.1 hypothetical protein [Brevibacillus halotolerans]
MTNHMTFAILVGLCATAGLFLFRRAVTSGDRQQGGFWINGLAIAIATLLVLFSSAIVVFLLVTILWTVGTLFPMFVDKSDFWTLVSFAVVSFFMLMLYELILEPVLLYIMQRLHISRNWKLIPEILATTFIFYLVNTTWISGVLLTPLTPLFVGILAVTVDYVLERIMGERR